MNRFSYGVSGVLFVIFGIFIYVYPDYFFRFSVGIVGCEGCVGHVFIWFTAIVASLIVGAIFIKRFFINK